ncbi:DUF1854 domain-containing protein [Niveibacterium sp. 24ML]|uniref:cyanophycin metabolism-associated DUF1854 family protein n=1 Tax=Niveibacterium sp. 24ML TaxID=2985512 RepID=UPI00226EE175|nr:DUF1854 domain-containing protein [Niveibacterium sp. 24ML]MCX9155207.1 DUF1854 domain-containing protein [Niveibacterium sp. 24ML]
MITWQIERNAFGRLVLTDAAGERHENVVPVRAFPIAAPEEGISLVSQDGHELVWLDRLADAPEAARALIEGELGRREFVPELRRLIKVSSFATPSTWTVQTDRGETSFVLRGEEDIRRLSGNTLMIADTHGIQFLIRDLLALDHHSRRLLDRFL